MGLLSFPESGTQKYHNANTTSYKRTSKSPSSNLENEPKSNEGKKGGDPFVIVVIPSRIQAISAPNLSCSFIEEVEKEAGEECSNGKDTIKEEIRYLQFKKSAINFPACF